MPLPVVVLFENPDWLPPLEAGLKAEGLTYELREVWQGIVDPDEEPAEAIYLNRMSPSSHTRGHLESCLLYTSPSPRDQRGSRMPSSA